MERVTRVKPDRKMKSTKQREAWIDEKISEMKSEGFRRFTFRASDDEAMTATKRPARKRKKV